MKQKKKKKTSKAVIVLLILIMGIAVCVLGYSLYRLLGIRATYQEASNLYEQVGDTFAVPETRPAALQRFDEKSAGDTDNVKDHASDADAVSVNDTESVKDTKTAADAESMNDTRTVPDTEPEKITEPEADTELVNNIKIVDNTYSEPDTQDRTWDAPSVIVEHPGLSLAEPFAEGTDEESRVRHETWFRPSMLTPRESFTTGTYPEFAGTNRRLTGFFRDSFASLNWDYAALKEYCDDAIGWIYQEGVMSYPIVQAEDNDKYLRHMINLEYNVAGSIFEDYRFPDGLDGRYAVIYGHNMDDGSMFGSITSYKKESYYQEHPSFEIYSGETGYRYYVYAAFQTEADGFVYTYDFDSDEEFLEHMKKLKAMSFYETKDITITPRSKVLILSTCIDYPRDYAYRYIAVLVRGEKLLFPAGR